MKSRHFYKEPDITKRSISSRFGNGEGKIITHPDGLYNPHLTIGELCLLRTIMHEIKGSVKDSTTFYTEVLPVFHRWILAKESPDLPIYLDIKEDFEKGTVVDFG